MIIDSTEVWHGIILVYAWMHCFEFWCWMFLDCKCLFFPGVYISKTSYIRQGENSLDGFYRAWHHVEYYRWMFDWSSFRWSLALTADFVITGTSGSFLMARLPCWRLLRTLRPLFLACVQRTPGILSQIFRLIFRITFHWGKVVAVCLVRLNLFVVRFSVRGGKLSINNAA